MDRVSPFLVFRSHSSLSVTFFLSNSLFAAAANCLTTHGNNFGNRLTVIGYRCTDWLRNCQCQPLVHMAGRISPGSDLESLNDQLVEAQLKLPMSA